MKNRIFIGCNYNDKGIKRQFDTLKSKIEKLYPLNIIIFDKRDSKKAKDIWRDIQNEIFKSQLCIFDLSGFRPNVVLELGIALSSKSEDNIIITYRSRNVKGKKPEWLLSDIGHLLRQEYKNNIDLEKFVLKEMEKIDAVIRLKDFYKLCDSSSSPDKNKEKGLAILLAIREKGPITKTEISDILSGSNLKVDRIIALLRKAKMVKLTTGNNGRITFPDN
jgi:hypothetical protein